MSSGRVITYIFWLKNHTTKSARPLGLKGLGRIWAFWPITSEDFKPLTQQIGPASRCKAALKLVHEWSGTCFQYNVKNQESIIYVTSLPRSDNAYASCGSCGGQIILRTSSDALFSIWGCVLKGIEDFNLEHCIPGPHVTCNWHISGSFWPHHTSGIEYGFDSF
jgi:hypothetical protein